MILTIYEIIILIILMQKSENYNALFRESFHFSKLDYSYCFLFNCTTEGQASDSLTALRKALICWLMPDACIWLGPPKLNLMFF